MNDPRVYLDGVEFDSVTVVTSSSASSSPSIVQEIEQELERAQRHRLRFASLHEAYAVILEELDEVWEVTKQKKRDRNQENLRKEFVQIAAMSVKAIQSMDNFVGGDV